MSARQAIIKWYADLGLAITTQRIALTASTSEAYAMLFKLLADPGDEILVPCPSYPLFEILARAECVQPVPYRLAYDGGWFLDFDSLRRAVSVRTKAIVVVNPNNPTGSYLKKQEARQLAMLAQEHALAIISDEVFMTYPAEPSDGEQVFSLIGLDDVLSFSLNGLSKAAGMPQMKLGWIVVNGPESLAASTVTKLELLLDSYLSVSTPVQKALPELLRIGAEIKKMIDSRLRANRAALDALAGGLVNPLASEGGWSSIVQVPSVRSEDEWIHMLLADHGVIAQPGYFYDMQREAYLVISLLTDPLDLTGAIGKLERLTAGC